MGNVELALVSDGTIRMDGGGLYGVVPKALWSRWAKADRKNRVTLGLNCVLIQSGGKNILVDTGAGNKHPRRRRTIFAIAAGSLVGNLKSIGVEPEDIHIVALSHLHFDHAGGCTTPNSHGNPFPTFPNATYLVQRSDWEEATITNERTRAAYFPEDFLPLEEKGQLDLLDGDREIAPDVWLKVTGGHTAGHQMVFIDSAGERAAYLGDVLSTPHHLPLPYISAWDLFPMKTLDSKRELLEQAQREGWLLVFAHALEHQAGYLVREEGRLKLLSQTI